jgi:hypothetical protein
MAHSCPGTMGKDEACARSCRLKQERRNSLCFIDLDLKVFRVDEVHLRADHSLSQHWVLAQLVVFGASAKARHLFVTIDHTVKEPRTSK